MKQSELADSYIKYYSLDRGLTSDIFKTYCRQFLDVNLGVQERLYNGSIFPIDYTNIDGLITTKVTFNGSSANYGYLPIKKTSEGYDVLIGFGTTYRSQDGEYISPTVTLDSPDLSLLSDILEYVDSTLYYSIEEHITKQINEGTIELTAYYAGLPTIPSDIINKLLELKKTIYCIVWLVNMTRVHLNMVYNHIHPVFLSIFMSTENIAEINRLIELFGAHTVKTCECTLGRMYNPHMEPKRIYNYEGQLYGEGDIIDLRAGCFFGMKIIPLPKAACKNLASHTTSVSVELTILQNVNRLLSGLVLNGVPIYYKHFIVKPIGNEIFNNAAILDRYYITDVLRTGDKVNGKPNEVGLRPKADNTTELSDTAVIFFMEHVGFTFTDLIKYAVPDPPIPSLIDYYFMLSRRQRFRKIIFNIAYDLYCLNKHLGIIHGDLHNNNVTCNDSFPLGDPPLFYRLGKKLRTIFVVDDVLFQFTSSQIVPVIIDFSRAIVNYNHNGLKGDGQLSFNKEYQDKLILKIISVYLPGLMETHKDTIIQNLQNNFDTVFRYLTLIDIYVFLKSTVNVLQVNKRLYQKIQNTQVQDLVEMSEWAKKTMETGLIQQTPVENNYWPIKDLMVKFFPKRIMTEEKANQRMISNDTIITDMFNANIDYKQLPTRVATPWISDIIGGRSAPLHGGGPTNQSMEWMIY